MVQRSVLLKEIDSLPPHYYDELLDFVKQLKEKAEEDSGKNRNSEKANTSMLNSSNFYERR